MNRRLSDRVLSTRHGDEVVKALGLSRSRRSEHIESATMVAVLVCLIISTLYLIVKGIQ